MKNTQLLSFRAIRFLVVFFCVATQAQAQFTHVVRRSGLALTTASYAIHGSFALAGGGVVLRSEARPDKKCVACEITDVTVTTNTDQMAFLTVLNGSSRAVYSAPAWLVRDAAVLVNSETKAIYRNVNLLGKPTAAEIADGNAGGDYWHVELSDALNGTKSGETLLVVDLIQTKPEFYSRYDLNFYSATNIDLTLTNDAPATDSPEMTPDESSNPNGKAVEKYLSRIKVFQGFENWTWADEDAGYTFSPDWKTQNLTMSGRPKFTYLAEDMDNVTNQFQHAINDFKYVLNICDKATNRLVLAVDIFNEATNDLDEATNFLGTAINRLGEATNLLGSAQFVLTEATSQMGDGANKMPAFDALLAGLFAQIKDFPGESTDAEGQFSDTAGVLNDALHQIQAASSQLAEATNFLNRITGGSPRLILKEEEVPTEYFQAYPQYIDNLNPQLFSSAVKFAQTASFFRYLKTHQPEVWKKTCPLLVKLPLRPGLTPRLIEQ